MTRLSEQLEHEAEVARTNLAADLGELRHRVTPGQIVDQAIVYVHDTWVNELGRNLLRNPVPLLLIGAASPGRLSPATVGPDRHQGRFHWR